MMRRFLLATSALVATTQAYAAPISSYPAASTLTGTEKIIATQGTSAVNITPAQLGTYVGASATTTGPYSHQIAQNLPTATGGGCLDIFTYLTPANQTAVLNGTASFDFTPIEQYAETALTVNSTGTLNGTKCIFMRAGRYYSSTTPNLKHTVKAQGEGVGQAGGSATVWAFAANLPGPFVNRYNTLDNTTVSPTTGADGTWFDGIRFESAGGTTSTSVNGISCRARCKITNSKVVGFPGYQIDITASSGSGGATEGNANGWVVEDNQLAGGVAGLHVTGADGNAGRAAGNDISNVLSYCIDDTSFLADTYIANQCATAGTGSIATYSGTQYYLLGSASAITAATTQPGTNSAIWVATSGKSGARAWTNGGQTWYNGGCFHLSNANANTVFIGGYCETDSPPSYGTSPAISLGGIASLSWTGTITALVSKNGGNLTNLTSGFAWEGTTGSEATSATFGGNNSNCDILTFSGATYFVNTYRLKCDGVGNIIENYNNSTSNFYRLLTGPGTALTAGRSTILPYAVFPHYLLVPDVSGGNSNARRMWLGVASCPSTTGEGVGSIAWNSAPAAGGQLLCMETTKGSPDTWIASYLNERNSPTTGIGYVTGAGGTVTQGTSRTTGVTLNKVSGQVTLFSAAGSATPFTFTVTNSTVAATDTVSVNVGRAATDRYLCFASPDAGHFDLTCVDESGTTTEAPVINFNVIKGVAS